MRKLLGLLFTVVCFSVSNAQQPSLVIEGSKPSFYLNHKVMPKENFYSIGRLYNISPKEIAPINNLDLTKGLALGQVIHIPLTANNFTISPDQLPAGETVIPLFHVVASKETLSKIISDYGASQDNLKKWNNLKTNAVKLGSKLIIGYLKVSKELSAFANKSLKKITPPEIPVKAEVKSSPTIAAAPEKPVKTDNPTPPVTTDNPVPAPTKTITSTIDFKGGVFKDLYSQQMKNKTETTENGISGVFKSTSGWQDGKFYCFNNTVPEGTIIKVTNNKSGKSIFAKVLDLIPEIKQNAGLLLQLSNAAAEELEVRDPKFDCTITYYK